MKKVMVVIALAIFALTLIIGCGGNKAIVKRIKTAKADQAINAAESKKSAVSNQSIEYVRMADPNKPSPSYAGKLAFDGYTWRPQIMLYNGATEDVVTQKMRNYVLNLAPNRQPSGKWDSFGYWLMDGNGKPLTTPAKVKDTSAPQLTQTKTIKTAATATAGKQLKAKTTVRQISNKEWRDRLAKLGYTCTKAVCNFQTDARADSLKIDGREIMVDNILGPQTKKAIDIYLFAFEKCRDCQTTSKVLEHAKEAVKAKKTEP